MLKPYRGNLQVGFLVTTDAIDTPIDTPIDSKFGSVIVLLLMVGLTMVTSVVLADQDSSLAPESLFQRILPKTKHTLFETVISNGVRQGPLETAFEYFDVHRSRIGNHQYLTIVDFSRHISARRMHIINLETGEDESVEVAHALNSDPGLQGFPVAFGNVFNSLKSALGFYLTLNTYQGTFGRSLALEGLSDSNSRALERKIVIHPWYVGPEFESRYGTKKCPIKGGCPTMGCFGVPFSSANAITDKLKGGSLLYAFTDSEKIVSNDH